HRALHRVRAGGKALAREVRAVRRRRARARRAAAAAGRALELRALRQVDRQPRAEARAHLRAYGRAQARRAVRRGYAGVSDQLRDQPAGRAARAGRYRMAAARRALLQLNKVRATINSGSLTPK